MIAFRILQLAANSRETVDCGIIRIDFRQQFSYPAEINTAAFAGDIFTNGTLGTQSVFIHQMTECDKFIERHLLFIITGRSTGIIAEGSGQGPGNNERSDANRNRHFRLVVSGSNFDLSAIDAGNGILRDLNGEPERLTRFCSNAEFSRGQQRIRPESGRSIRIADGSFQGFHIPDPAP